MELKVNNVVITLLDLTELQSTEYVHVLRSHTGCFCHAIFKLKYIRTNVGCVNVEEPFHAASTKFHQGYFLYATASTRMNMHSSTDHPFHITPSRFLVDWTEKS
jgi:hypothetical protein